jgi:hypothetical protein
MEARYKPQDIVWKLGKASRYSMEARGKAQDIVWKVAIGKPQDIVCKLGVRLKT